MEEWGINTKQAIELILQYADYLDVVKAVEEKKETLPEVEYSEFVRSSLNAFILYLIMINHKFPITEREVSEIAGCSENGCHQFEVVPGVLRPAN